MKLLTERYQAELLGVLSCYDRIIITGTLPGACYAGGMTSFLHSRHIKIFDYAKVFADPLRERIRKCAHELADAHGVSIEHVNKPNIRKEDPPCVQGNYCSARQAFWVGAYPFRDGGLFRLRTLA